MRNRKDMNRTSFLNRGYAFKGRQKLGDFIRKIDYLNVKDEYENSEDDPSEQISRFEDKCYEITFPEFKDAFAAFEEKICIPGFPERYSPAYNVAYKTVEVLQRLSGQLLEEQANLRASQSQVLLHAVVALIKAGPGSTHTELMNDLMDKTEPEVSQYAKTLSKADLLPLMTATRVQFKFPPNEMCQETHYASYQGDQLQAFFLMFTADQLKTVHTEFLETYLHYQRQLPSLSEDYGKQIVYLVKGMVEEFQDDNPYLGLKNKDVIKAHLSAVRDMVLSEGYRDPSPTNDAAVFTLTNIIKAVMTDGYIEDVSDTLISTILELNKQEKFRQQGNNIYDVFAHSQFEEFKNRKLTPGSKFYQSCVRLVSEIVSHDEISEEEVKLVSYCLDSVIQTAKILTPGDMTTTLSMVNGLLGTGLLAFIKQGDTTLAHLVKIKALDWKKHLDEAKKILTTVATIPEDKMERKDNIDDVMSAYQSFINNFKDQLKTSKVVAQLKPNLVEFYFDCLVTSPPLKVALADDISGREYMNFKKDTVMRGVVLKKINELLKKADIPWDNSYLTAAVVKILRSIVDCYDSNGKKVTEEENSQFLSLYTGLCDGGQSVLEHFCEDEDENSLNYRFEMLQKVIRPYVELHKESGTVSVLSPMIPEVLHWTKLALGEEHKRMTQWCIGILNWVGLAKPAVMKDHLPEIIDIMIEYEQYDQLNALVSTLYAHNPSAVHDRLQEMFDKFSELAERDQQEVAKLLQYVGQKHPEQLTPQEISAIIDAYKDSNSTCQYLLMTVIRAIGDKSPRNLVNFFPQLCDDTIFDEESLNYRLGIITTLSGINEELAHKAIDYLIKFVDSSDPYVPQLVMGSLYSMARAHAVYMQKHKVKLEQLEKETLIPSGKEMAHYIIMMIEGKSLENVADGLDQQKEDTAKLDTKVDATIGTIVTIGDKVIEHDKEIGELETGLGRVEERVDDVEGNQEETKMKIEEIDKKTMSNAPKWSRDLTKLMNPKVDNDWRLLASRLGYSKDDIRAWATQHDPCMAILSEWYATHRTSEATYGVLTALTEMNRLDGAAIVENAMKQAEDVVEDEEFEYPRPPPVFISYQWGVQNEVKLLKQHLNMAGYECWMDVGQMGGGDKLFAKIDNGIRGAKVVICCTTEKYAQSPNCNREVNLSVNLNKPIIPLLMEKMDWPPKGSMGPIFSEYLFIRFFQRGGEETPEKDQRYWPIPKFQELLLQLNFFAVPDQKMVKKEYAKWWVPIAEEIVIDKMKRRTQTADKGKAVQSQAIGSKQFPQVFLSYQWGKQPQVTALYHRLTSLGYTVWMDIYQMGGGDSLYDKIDRGMIGCKAVVACITQKYSLSANCRREVTLADALKKPVLPLLMEEMKWPPDGPMSMILTELLYIDCNKQTQVQENWKGHAFDKLIDRLNTFIQAVTIAKENEKDSSKQAKTHNVKSDMHDANVSRKSNKTNTVNGVQQNSKIKAETSQSNTTQGSKTNSMHTDKSTGNKDNAKTNEKKLEQQGQTVANKTRDNQTSGNYVQNNENRKTDESQNAVGNQKSQKSKACAIL